MQAGGAAGEFPVRRRQVEAQQFTVGHGVPATDEEVPRPPVGAETQPSGLTTHGTPSDGLAVLY